MNKITCYNNTEVHVIDTNDFNEVVGVVYPGQRYYLSSPSLFFLQQLFKQNKICYYGVDTRYGDSNEYMSSDEQEKTNWIDNDSELIAKHIDKYTKSFKQKIYIGKSLGTVHLYNQIKQNHIHRNDLIVFQTPVMPYVELQQLLIEREIESLIIYGTSDYTIEKLKYKRISSRMNVRVLEIENAGHIFEDNLNIERSIENVKSVIIGIKEFLVQQLRERNFP